MGVIFMTFLILMPGSVPKCFAPGSQIFKWFSLYWRRKITSLEMALKCFSGPEFINLDPFLDLILGCGIFFCKNVFFTPKPITTKKNFGFQKNFFSNRLPWPRLLFGTNSFLVCFQTPAPASREEPKFSLFEN